MSAERIIWRYHSERDQWGGHTMVWQPELLILFSAVGRSQGSLRKMMEESKRPLI